jgi:hypothetical protein
LYISFAFPRFLRYSLWYSLYNWFIFSKFLWNLSYMPPL